MSTTCMCGLALAADARGFQVCEHCDHGDEKHVARTCQQCQRMKPTSRR